MEKMNRRIFCGTSLMALPLMSVFAENNGMGDYLSDTDPVLDTLVDQFSRTTLDGTRNGFGAYHFRQYAGQMRIFNAYLNEKGTNKILNRKLDDDDYHLFNPDHMVQFAMKYWKKRGITLDENSLTDQIAIDAHSYGSIKKSIKKLGGLQKLNEHIAQTFERTAEKYQPATNQSGMTSLDSSMKFPALHGQACSANFKYVQDEISDYIDPVLLIGIDLDCLCKAMAVEGALLSLGCVTFCPPCCVPAAIMIGFVTLMEQLNYCDTNNC